MHRFRLAIVVATVVAAGAVVSTAGAAFSGKVCDLLTAKQVATVQVSPLKCTALKAFKGSGLTNYYGNWGGTGAVASHLTISIVSYTSTTLFQAAKKNLGLLPRAKKVSGIGSLAYESSGGDLTIVNFVVGKDICNFNLRTKQPPKLAAVNKLAKTVAAKL